VDVNHDRVTSAPFEDCSGRGVRILVVDSGVDGTHPMLAETSIAHYAVERGVNDAEAQVVAVASHDPIGHGTAVASIIRRLVPNAELSSVAVLGRKNRGTTENLFVALDWAASQGFDVVNVSLGTTYLSLLPKFKERLDRLYLAGCIVVSACSNLDPDIVEYPAHFTSVISVEQAKLATLALERTSRLVEFRASGVDVHAAWRDGKMVSVTGSSFAAPHVSAIVARMKERHPHWNATEIKAALYALVSPSPSPMPVQS